MSGPLTTSDVRSARTMLFVPGNRPERFAKAAAAGSDMVVLDLEDAVPESDKAQAREHVFAWLEAGGGGAVRINAAGTAWHDDDLSVAASHGCPVMVPKAEPTSLERIVDGLPDCTEVIPLVETAIGVHQAAEICAVAGVARPAFGSVDLATELGVAHDDPLALATARSLLVLGAAVAGVGAPLDGVCTALDDEAALLEELGHAVRLGMTGKLCVHPRQVVPIHGALAPTETQLAWARKVVETSGSGAAVAVDGQMVDKPVLDRARVLLARSR